MNRLLLVIVFAPIHQQKPPWLRSAGFAPDVQRAEWACDNVLWRTPESSGALHQCLQIAPETLISNWFQICTTSAAILEDPEITNWTQIDLKLTEKSGKQVPKFGKNRISDNKMRFSPSFAWQFQIWHHLHNFQSRAQLLWNFKLSQKGKVQFPIKANFWTSHWISIPWWPNRLNAVKHPQGSIRGTGRAGVREELGLGTWARDLSPIKQSLRVWLRWQVLLPLCWICLPKGEGITDKSLISWMGAPEHINCALEHSEALVLCSWVLQSDPESTSCACEGPG